MDPEVVFSEQLGKLVVKCKVCEKSCDTVDQYNVHRSSAKHIKKCENLKGRQLFMSNSSQSTSFASQSMSIPSQSMSIASQSMSIPSQSMSIASPYNATQTLLSQFSCEICKVNCNTRDQLNSHFSGKDHAKKLLRSQNMLWKDETVSILKTAINIPTNCDDRSTLHQVHMTSVPVIKSMEPVLKMKYTDTPELSAELADILIPERRPNFIKCKLCNLSTDTQEQYVMHCNGTKHKRKMKSLHIGDTPIETDMHTMQIGDNDFIYCEACGISIHSNNMESHLKGKIHKEKMVKKSHTIDVANQLLKKSGLSPKCESMAKLKFEPRNYQMEVYEKSLKNDCVIFLPTGTGKTFVAAMIILKMLEENPHHRVAFLVDKVLLVMQQHDFLKNQFEDISLNRFDSNGSEINRPLKMIGLANSYLMTEHGVSVRDHDVVVATAELFRGLLANKQLFWEEFGLVILDEAHHCVKDHPYNRLLREYQLYPKSVLIDKSDVHAQLQKGTPRVNEKELTKWKQSRSKIIGLTASPSGSQTIESTHTLLLQLLEAMGGVDIVNTVEYKKELESYTSNSNIETKLLNYSENEIKFRKTMTDTFFFMMGKYERFITVSRGLETVRDCHTLTVEDVSDFKSQLINLYNETENTEKSTINHVLKVLDIIDVLDTFGYKDAYDQLKELLDNENEKVWLQNNTIVFIPEAEEIINTNNEEKSAVLQAIVEEAGKVSGISRTILVLVKERKTARKMGKELSKECSEQELHLLLGHGSGSSKNQKETKGMKVIEQKKALGFIKEGNNQIIVATSVADEGIDLPSCDLVILINPPNTVQALVQVRGRARKKTSRLLMICREQRTINSLKILEQQERNIIASIELIVSKKMSE